jgi:two-component system nitrate/nitrite response regulator NarL
MKILLVDDHAILSEGVEALLKARKDLSVVAKVTSAQFAIAALKGGNVDLMVTDYSMPDMSGLELIQAARAIHRNLKIIVLSMHDEKEVVAEVMTQGVDAYVLKKHTHYELLHAIDTVSRGGQFWSQEIAKWVQRVGQVAPPGKELTSRELEILKLLVEELTSREIAARLSISERTVEAHRQNLLKKTQSSSIAGLIKYAFSRNML